MGKQLSFTGVEKEFAPILRDKVSRTEDRVDLENHFARTVINFLDRVFVDKDVSISIEDIIFTPEKESFFELSDNLKKNSTFAEVWENSDLHGVLKRFSETANSRYMHLIKHPEKTEKKIRN